MPNKTPIIIIVIFIAVLAVLSLSVYIVSETEQVVITQFGKYKRVEKEAGLHFKKPIVEKANYFDKRLLEWDGKATQVPTLEKRLIWVDTFARWRIDDPLKFFQTVKDENTAHSRLDGIIDSAVRNQISNHLLIEAIRSSNRPMLITVGIEGERIDELQNVEKGRDKLTEQILAEATSSAQGLGIELVDIRIKRINYVEEVQMAAYQRMIVERKQIAAKYRSEGEGRMMEIQGQKEQEEKEILSEAYKLTQDIMGKADAQAIKIYAEAYSKDPEFYSFLKTLESYEKNLEKAGIVILSTDSDYFKYLKSPDALSP
jgi:membrane protease subunit HflC